MEYKIGFISDLHTFHNKWYDNLQYNQWGHELHKQWEELDILIFSGDCSSRGYFHELRDFLSWFAKQPARHKIMIAGNHDFGFEQIATFDREEPHNSITAPPFIEELIPEDVIYLNDESYMVDDLIKVWGSPVTPWFYNWAFNRYRSQGKDYVAGGIKQHWNMIPDDTDILVVHGPPRGILDRLSKKFQRPGENPNVGCDDLMDAINRVKPKVTCFGHIHEGYGYKIKDGMAFVNASCLNDSYEPVNPPQFLTLVLQDDGTLKIKPNDTKR